ncbi:aminodeoxychorismate synthase component I [Dyadobacter chenwenxiniae]|uniref:Aminodeoxychorismate synthase component I n=1 Tax=Dyadobacter chenwenxiniae TaxID=2906456 RepID=A0A9X1PSJ2_9BACT|nr:aminodeoxychorismate synthase component I [Dyadobacter chenwenxiniae]MCF0064326.1 aminodeoxychorismate synthase component I [Dyadobacter chenwenxiniae]UON82463.1 aminodeoxychorismate synthase component I [Dyadobacter chenwenxiniae]
MEDLKRNFAEKLNAWGKSKTPFVFLVDYRIEKPLAWTLDDENLGDIRFNLNGFGNRDDVDIEPLSDFQFHKFPVSFETYLARFDYVVSNLKAGNSFLVNLSLPTDITTNLSLAEIFDHSEAPYRFLYKDEFVCFSPEVFVKIKGNRISSFPMKGTIDGSVADAENVILSDSKEAAEHATIVDLIRNDLSMVAEKVWVEKYRYIDRIQTNDKTLLQVSSEIAGILPDDFDGKYGDLLLKMLPAGSITGAPKPSTLKIIEEAENYDRGYYTGVMGYFDGENFESAVMIRFIENQNGKLVFKSGGGITAQSNARNEYQELIDKVYLPFSHVPHIMF